MGKCKFLLTLIWRFDILNKVDGRVAERLGTGLQNPSLRFNSGRDLKNNPWAGGGIGIRTTLKMSLRLRIEGSSPSLPTE